MHVPRGYRHPLTSVRYIYIHVYPGPTRSRILFSTNPPCFRRWRNLVGIYSCQVMKGSVSKVILGVEFLEKVDGGRVEYWKTRSLKLGLGFEGRTSWPYQQ